MVLLYILGVEIIIYMLLLIIFKVPDFYRLLGELKNKFSSPSSFPNDDDSDGENIKYDIAEFNKRIEKLRMELTMDDDGLYDVKDYDDEFTGTEIITESREVELDRY